jgi:hypothetical protein
MVGRRGRNANVIDPPGDFIRLELLLRVDWPTPPPQGRIFGANMCIVAYIVLLPSALSAPAASYGAGGGE